MKKLLIALVFGGVVFSSVFAVAATLGLTTDNLGAGDSAVESCDTAVNVEYTSAFDVTPTAPATTPHYDLDDVLLTDLLAACNGQYFKISILNSDYSVVTEHVGTITSVPSFAVDFLVDDIRAEDVYHVAVVITTSPPPAP